MIKRELYLSKIRGFYFQNDLIKIITGMRRSGKSILLTQIMNELRDSGISDDHIIYINFEDFDFADIKEARQLDEYLKSKIIDDETHYIFLDEIQSVNEFEKVVNSYRSKGKSSIFITGSNSRLLAGEFSTLLSGRYVSFLVMPFSFSEMFEYVGGDFRDRFDIFDKYREWGGMPQLYNMQNEAEYRPYLEDLFGSIVLRDITTRYNLKDEDLLRRILQFVIENIGHIFSANSIAKYLKSENIGVSPNTLYSYLDKIESSMMLNRVSRYDIRGKKVIQFYEKFFLIDLGLAQLKKSSIEKSIGGRLENIAYNNLLAHGYKIYIGEINNKEIDFIAENSDGLTYIQVADTLSDINVLEREFGALEEIGDNYSKLVLSLDRMDYSRSGIKHENIVDWLLRDL